MSLNAFADGYNKGYRAGYEDAQEDRAHLEARVRALEAEVSEARAEATEVPGLRLAAHAFTISDAGGPRLFAACDGADATWTVYRVTISNADDGSIVRDIAIARDSVTADRLPAVLSALLTPAPTE